MALKENEIMRTHRHWPVKLFWLPYGSPVSISLGLVSSSFLMQKRCRQGQGGCLVALDVNLQSPGGGPSSFTVIPEKKVGPADSGCKRESRNSRVARAAVKLLVADQSGLKSECHRALPRRIQCGHLRSAIRSVFSENLTPVEELSIKSAQKLELSPCRSCASGTAEILRRYKEERSRPAGVDVEHIRRFKRAVGMLVPTGWDLRKGPYIPNGHGSLHHTRRDGGNWRVEAFSRFCRTELVYSAGKPRVVTLYSSRNVELLTPLHHSLYANLRRGGWLLVGSPTDEQVRRLDHLAPGNFVSVDYKSATDNIKTPYVRAMVEVLKEKSRELTPDESEALDVLANLSFDPGDAVGFGQPMGSPMSFPLLCLINKAVVDLSLADLLETGKISWKQFQEHRCLVNGDDLLFREFDSSLCIRTGILRHGALAGLVLNEEKTIVCPDWAEINSTPFFRGQKVKKTNVGVLLRSREVTDPVGFLADSLVKKRNFALFLRRWFKSIAECEVKLQGPLPKHFYRCCYSRHVRAAFTAVPTGRQNPPNPFPVVPKPAGYSLTREEEIASIHRRRDRLRSQGYSPQKSVRRAPEIKWGQNTIQRALRREKPLAEDNILKVLADEWEWLTKEKLKEDEAQAVLEELPPGDEGSRAADIIDNIRAFKQRKLLGCAIPDAGPSGLLGGDAFSRECDFVAFE